MKKILFLSVILSGFVFAANAQTAADKPATATGTEVKPDEQKPTEVQKPTDVQPAQAAQPAQPAATATGQAKKECAGHSHGSGSCAKAGEGKACCKAKTGTSSSSTPASGSTATAGDNKPQQSADKGKTKSCEHKECCKKKAEEKSGS